MVEIVGDAMKQLMETLVDPEMRQGRAKEDLTGVNLPLEEVQLAGEKVNYRIALNPEIFFRYSVFKARAASLGRKWDGTFSDFIDLDRTSSQCTACTLIKRGKMRLSSTSILGK